MLEILKYTIPALLVILVVYLMLHLLFKSEREKRENELKKANLPVVTPTRLRAYERLTLLLERMNPNNLLVQKANLNQTCFELQTSILDTIHREFEHNISQQIYVSDELWDQIDDARENLIQLINTCAVQCKPDEPASKLATMIVEIYNTPDETALSVALDTLKKEVKELF
jgi:hypothetical protein